MDDKHPVEWAYEYMGVSASDSFERVSRAVHAENRIDVSPHLRIYARDIVLALSRFQEFRDNPEYNSKFLRIPDDQTPFQNVLLFLLRRLHELSYRRITDSCYEMIRDMSGAPSFAWTRVCTVREFILREIRKETVPEQWKNLTNPRDNLDVVSRHLVEVEHPEFASLLVDPWIIAFHNGLYSIKDNVFWSRDRTSEWPVLGNDVEIERRAHGWGEDYTLSHPTDSTCACNFVDTPFRPCDDNAKPMREIGNILSKLGVDESMHWWFCVLMGRLLFPTNKWDRWQVMPYIKTVDMADNSALAAFIDIFRHLLGSGTVTHIVSGSKALETLSKSRIGVMLLRDSMPLEQGEWQSWTTGEPVVINPGGGQTPYSYEPTGNLLAIGSHIGYKNDAGTVDRRVVMFDMSMGTPELFNSFRHTVHANIDIWLQTIVDAYLTATHQYGTRDLWAAGVFPPSMHSLRQTLREITTPLLSCIMSDSFRRDPSFFMPLSNFKDMYQEYRRRRGLPTQRWMREHWQATFQDMSLTIDRGAREYQGTRNTEWLCGIDTVERSEINALTITTEALSHLKYEHTRLDGELQRAQARLELAEMLFQAESKVEDWKAKRHQLRHRYRVLDQESETAER